MTGNQCIRFTSTLSYTEVELCLCETIHLFSLVLYVTRAVRNLCLGLL